MSYTTNKNMPRIRREAVRLFNRHGWTARKVGRYLGYHHTAVMEWVRKARVLGDHPIPIKSSKPNSHPKQLKSISFKKHKRIHPFALICYSPIMDQSLVLGLLK